MDRFNLYDDVYYHKVGKRYSELVTRGLRVRQPTLSPDGETMVMVKNKVQQNQLSRLTVDKKLDVFTQFEDHAQLAIPEFSPDGRHLALSVWANGVRDIWIYTADGTPFRRVTSDPAHDMDPTWSADGRWLYWSSDRTGVFNIYAVNLESESVYQVTNVVGGAFHPAPHPDGTRLAFESFSNNGPDIVEILLGMNHWRGQGRLVAPLVHAGPLEATRAPDPRPRPRPRRLPRSSRAPTSVLRSYPEDWQRRCPSATCWAPWLRFAVPRLQPPTRL